VADLIVRRTQGVSAAFIKELMRRAAQFQIETGADTALQERSIDRALQDMVCAGGSLNVKLLGGATPPLLDADRASSTRITVARWSGHHARARGGAARRRRQCPKAARLCGRSR